MLGAQQQKRIESIRQELDYCLHKMNDVDSVGRGLEDLRILVAGMELGDIPGVLSSGILDSAKMRPMGRRFSIKVVDYIVEHFGAERTLAYLGQIMSFLIQGCRDTEVHVQNSAVATIGLIASSYLAEETFQLNQDVVDLFFDPLIHFAKKECNPAIQMSSIAAISSAIDGMSTNLVIMNLNKLMGSLVPIMMNPNTSEACRAVAIDALRKIVVLIWTFLQETPFGSSPNMYDLKRKQDQGTDLNICGGTPELKQVDGISEHLILPITWKQICSIFNGILKELHPNYTSNSKNVNVRSASLSLLTEIMVCCFVAQAGALLAAHNSSIPLQKPIDGIKAFAEVIINVVNLGAKDKSPKVREVAQYCIKRLQEANETYIPDSNEFMGFAPNMQIVEKEQFNSQNISKITKTRSRVMNENFFKNATDEIVVMHNSPPNWRHTQSETVEGQEDQTKPDTTRSSENDLPNQEDKCSASGSSIAETQSVHSNNDDTVDDSVSQENTNKVQSLPPPQHVETGNQNIFLAGSNYSSVVSSNVNTPLPSPLYIVAQPPVIQGHMMNYSGMNQESYERQLILEKKVDELSKEVKRLSIRQNELESIAHVLKMVAIHRVDSLEEKIKGLSDSLQVSMKSAGLELEITDANKSGLEGDLMNLSADARKEMIGDFRRQLYNKAREIVENESRDH
ncbi:membrane domain-containing protein [Cryptosporidium canis]|uniref:Membrane domain-containing protein n=1 Tax=Cryptosporidium canis TaxID=195482 RepID=A0ABQ8PC62_9CRYT|nr:membrane domain-containing protein [Cryptosporidium canis]KAJ1615499.1 membrane domain-containing protein [Cryptosporidium canis]